MAARVLPFDGVPEPERPRTLADKLQILLLTCPHTAKVIEIYVDRILQNLPPPSTAA